MGFIFLALFFYILYTIFFSSLFILKFGHVRVKNQFVGGGVYSDFLVGVIFLPLWSFLNFSFLPWGVSLSGVIIFFMGLCLFMTIIVINLLKIPYTAHLVGRGERFLMRMFFFFIHILGEVIKPLSLTLRLGINLMFGHIILKILFIFFRGLGLFFIVPFIFFELGVFLIQSFVFTFLLKLYLIE